MPAPILRCLLCAELGASPLESLRSIAKTAGFAAEILKLEPGDSPASAARPFDLVLLGEKQSDVARTLSGLMSRGVLAVIVTDDPSPENVLKWLNAGAWDCVGNSAGQLSGMLYRAHQRLHEEQTPGLSELLTLTDNSPNAVFVTNESGDIIFTNPSFTRHTGISSQEAKGRRIEMLDSGYESTRLWNGIWNTLLNGGKWSGDMKIRREDGTLLDWNLTFMPVLSRMGPVRYIGIARDTTQEESLRHQLQHAQKMESLGHMACGIAHDFNNVLTTIIGIGYLLRDDIPPDAGWREDLEELLRAAEQGSHLTRQLLAFSARQQTEPQIIDLNALVLSLQKLFNRIIGSEIELYVIHNITDATTLADPGQVEQTLLNIVVNARDAMPSGGQLRIVLEKREVNGAEAEEAIIEPGIYNVISVADSGTGISPHVLEHMFDAFFTTKESGRGTGLGLSTSKAIMRRLGGGIRAESTLGEGSTFYLYYPYVSGELEPVKEEWFSVEGKERILLVEDEDMVRELAARVLRRLGYVIIEAIDGVDALDRVASEKEPFDLLVSDVTMPRMGGPKLAERLREIQPGIPVLFICGYANNVVLENEVAGTSLLHKPFTPREFAAKVREILKK